MPLSILFLVPALVAQAPEAPRPTVVEMKGGLFVLKGVPDAETFAELKRLRVTHVIDLRSDDETPGGSGPETAALQVIGAEYMRYAVSRTPPAADFSFIREILRGMPRGARILVHCSTGNRAAAVVCPWLVLEKGMALEEALKLSHQAGLQNPATEEAMRAYLKGQAKT